MSSVSSPSLHWFLRQIRPDRCIRVAHVAAEVMARAKPLAKQGRPTKGSADDEKGDDGTFSRGSNSADYLAARIKRDRPDIADRVQAPMNCR
jgi:hypothetical protein